MIATSIFNKHFFAPQKIINTLIMCTLLSLLTTSFAKASDDLTLVLTADTAGQTALYDLTKDIKAIKDNTKKSYHATVGWIPNGKKVKYNAELKKWMEDALKAEPAIPYFSAGAAIYRVSSECPDPDSTPNSKLCKRYAIVLMPDKETTLILKEINQRLYDALQDFNAKYKTSYAMYDDITPRYFTPHITLATTAQVLDVNRSSVVNDINAMIAARQFLMVNLKKY